MRLTRFRRMCASFHASVVTPRISAKSALPAFQLLSLIAISLLFAAPVAAQEENRAGLVIVHGDGSMVTQCIAFAEESIAGAELLARSKFDLSMEASSMGATICRIDGEGCDFPADACFCQCQGSPCIYWSYWRLTEGEWRYSNIGAGNAVVRHGSVDGWRWGPGTIDKAEPPFAITFEDICVEPIQASEPMPAGMGAGDEVRPSVDPSPQTVASQAVSSQAVSSQAVSSQAVATETMAATSSTYC